MVNWYADILEYYRQSEGTQDDSGHFVEIAGTWIQLGKCRIEKDAHGASISDNANVQMHSYTIYTPTDTQLPKQGQRIRITKPNGAKIECSVLDAELGILHGRIWAH